MKLDLHIHTNASDGAWPPREVVAAAASGGLHVIAVADHDTTAAVAVARAAGRERDVQVIPALEMSSTWEDREIHILGYYVDPEDAGLREHARRAATLREARMREMVSRLSARGVEVPFGEVVEAAGPEAGALSRPHLAKVLVAHGFASSVADAFNSLIGDQHAAFVPTRLQPPEAAIERILAAGGLPVWAHPPGDLVDSLLGTLRGAGLEGLEVYRPNHRRNDVLRLEEVCRTTGLVATGGSDWHTPDGGTRLGDFFVLAEEVRSFLDAGGM